MSAFRYLKLKYMQKNKEGKCMLPIQRESIFFHIKADFAVGSSKTTWKKLVIYMHNIWTSPADYYL